MLDEFSWALPILVGASAVALLIYLEPSWGANAAASLGFLIGVVGIVVSILIDRGYFKAIKLPGAFRRWQKRAVAASIATLMVFGLVWWGMKREGDPFDYMSGTVLIGYTGQNYPGWHTRPDGLPNADNGFDVAVAAALKQKFYNADFQWVALDGLEAREDALRFSDPDSEKSVKLVISNFSITPERQKVIDFAGPYFHDVQGLLSRTGSRTPSQKENLLCGIGASTGVEAVGGLGWAKKAMPTLDQCMTAYDRGEVHGVSTDMSILQPYVKARADAGRPVQGVVVDLQAIGTERYGIGIPNNRPKLCEALNEAIDDFLADSWDATYSTFLKPAGVTLANKNPQQTAECEAAGPSFLKD